VRQDEIRATDIALVGMACRFPGASTVEKFWQNLQEGRDTATFFSDEQLLAEGISQNLLQDPLYVKAGQILPDIDMFDAELFKITSDEAEILDPQHRQFLECAVEVLESAGYDQELFPGRIGVYAGVGMNTYLLCNLADRYRKASSVDRYRLMLANDKDFVATRVSYKLNLRGPSVSVNTACSTSLVAVHLACLSLLSGECDLALAGCAHIRVPQTEGYMFQQGMIFSPDGRCRAFDAKAQGTIVGNGVGIVALKRLKDALTDGDWIHAVIKGTALNNDGGLKASYTAPSVDGQAAVITEAQMMAGCEADTISYIETHGTGTSLGDPIEFKALTQAFSLGTNRRRQCAIGSVKTNVGHLDVAAGMAGLIKTCLMLQHKRLVPSLHFEEPNPEINFDDSPFYVNTALKDWDTNGIPRRAGVSSFGIGGTNAHVVLEEPPPRQIPLSEQPFQLLTLSARSPKALDRTINEFARYLKRHSELNLSDVAYTLSTGRRPYAHRLAMVCSDNREAALTLTLGDHNRIVRGQIENGPHDVAFVFNDCSPGDGVRLSELYNALRSFRNIVDSVVGLLNNDFSAGPATLPLAENTTTSFIWQYSLSRLWMSWNVRPKTLMGFGVGEVVAECLKDTLPLTAAFDRVREYTTGSRLESSDAAAPKTALLPDAISDTQIVISPDQISPSVEQADRKGVGSCLEALLRRVGQLWTNGIDINWSAFYSDQSCGRVPLPPRPFERKRYWIDADLQERSSQGSQPKLKQQIAEAGEIARVQLVVDFIQQEIARILGNESDQFDADTSVFDLGIDSLILIEIASKLTTEMEHSVSPSLFVDHFTIRAFSVNLIKILGYEVGRKRPLQSTSA
jgi:acyl transferase domain-containing protein